MLPLHRFLVAVVLPAYLMAACGSPGSSEDGDIILLPPMVTEAELGSGPFYADSTLTVAPSGWQDGGGEEPAYDYQWYVNGKPVGKATQASFAGGFKKNDTVFCRVTPKAGDRVGEPIDSNTAAIANTSPQLQSVSLTPALANEAATLAATVAGAQDADGDAVTYTYTWLVNGVAVAGAAGATLSGAAFDKGDSVVVRVTPDDQDPKDGRLGQPVDSAPVVIANTAPAMSSVTLSTGPHSKLSTITIAAHTGWSDVDPADATPAYQYQWQIDAGAAGVWADIAGATSATLASSSFNRGDKVRVRVAPFDGTHAGAGVTSDEITVVNAAPSLAAAPLAAAPYHTNSVIAVTPTGWSDADGDAPAYVYDWYINGVHYPSATTSTITGAAFGKGVTVQTRITPTDGLGAGAAVWSSIATIANSAPSVSGANLNGTYFTEVSTITVSPAGWSDADGDAPGYQYQWYVNDTAVSGATTAALSGSKFAKHDTVFVRVTPDDQDASGANLGTPIDSATVTIANTAPAMTGVALAAGPFDERSTITIAALTGWADVDPADTTPAYQYQWQIDVGTTATWADIAGATGTTLDGASFNRGDSVRLRVYPYDGEAAGAVVTSGAAGIVNAAPALNAVTVSTAPFYTNDTLTAWATGWSDADGDAPGFAYQWYRNGWAVTGATLATLSGVSAFDKHDAVFVRVTPDDGQAANATGTPVDSAAVTIENSLPALASVTLSGSYRTDDLIIVAAYGAFTDADGDAPGYTYQWYVDAGGLGAAVPVVGETGDSLAGVHFAAGDQVYVQVSPDDGEGLGLAVNSNAITIANTPPTLTGVSIDAGVYYVDTPVTAGAFGALDADSDATSYVYRWFVNGVSTAVSTTGTLAAGNFAKGQTVSVAAFATDGMGLSGPVTASAITILNRAPSISAVSLGAGPFPSDGDLTATVTDVDLDNDVLTKQYQWYVNGVSVAVTAAVLPSSYFGSTDQVFVRVWTSDGEATAGPADSATVTITNAPPGAPGITLLPGFFAPGENLEALVSTPSLDPDGDTVSYTYAWYKNGAYQSALGNVSKVATALLTNNDTWQVYVTPGDGTATGAAASASVSIRLPNEWTAMPTAGAPVARFGPVAAWTGSELVVWGGSDNGGVYLTTGGRYNPVTNAWLATQTGGAPSSRSNTRAVWSGSEMIIWGGYSGGGPVNTGGRYNPSTNSWTATTTLDAPTARYGHSAVWTGKEMIVWGANSNTGGRYDPVGDVWYATATTNAPASRASHTAVWTGTEMIVWGGTGGGYLDTGGRYNPETDTWVATPTSGAPSARSGHQAVWSGKEMIIWGDGTGGNTGARYNPITDTWSAMTTSNAPDGRYEQAMDWTGNELIVWGGINGLWRPASCGRYNPVTNTWTAMTPAVTGRNGHVGIWTGHEFLIWGGYDTTFQIVGVRYRQPARGNDAWSFMSATTMPARAEASMVYTGTQALIWGGKNGSTTFADGHRYTPATDTWIALPATTAVARSGHTAVWTGSEMVIWGGTNGAPLADGMRYNPALDSWSGAIAATALAARSDHTAVWTGKHMIVWGGSNGAALSDGDRYDPALDAWTGAIASSGLSGRTKHTAKFTGAVMIVWGGTDGAALGDGAVYDVNADMWAAMAAAPITARYRHGAAWTGKKLVVWGGTDGAAYQGDGATYDPSANQWATMSSPTLTPRADQVMVWTGDDVLIWGGLGTAGALADGRRYDVYKNTWSSLASAGLAARANAVAVNTGTSRLGGATLVWGGTDGASTYFSDGAKYGR